jgi:hypothetical protein
MSASVGDLETGGRRDPAGECLVRVAGADIQERVAVLGSEDRNPSLDCRVFADMYSRG